MKISLSSELESKFNFPDKATSLNMNSLKFLQDYNNAMIALNNKVDKDKVYKKFSKMKNYLVEVQH